MAILKEDILSSTIHNDTICDALVEWGNANGFPVSKAKMFKGLGTYAAFSSTFVIKALRKPPIPGGWDVVVEDFEAEERHIPLNVDENGEIHRFVRKMVGEYEKEGLDIKIADDTFTSYGLTLRDMVAKGHPILLNEFEDIIEQMR